MSNSWRKIDVGFQPWTGYFFQTDPSVVGIYILKTFPIWQHISVLYLNFCVRLSLSYATTFANILVIWKPTFHGMGTYALRHTVHGKVEQGCGLVNCSERERKTFFNCQASGNLWQYTTVTSQCEKLIWNWTCRVLVIRLVTSFQKASYSRLTY